MFADAHSLPGRGSGQRLDVEVRGAGGQVLERLLTPSEIRSSTDAAQIALAATSW